MKYIFHQNDINLSRARKCASLANLHTWALRNSTFGKVVKECANGIKMPLYRHLTYPEGKPIKGNTACQKNRKPPKPSRCG